MLRTPLTEQQFQILTQERALLENLRVTLARLDAVPEDQRRLEQSLRQLEELFLLVVVGEFNAGKSAFINALLGQSLLAEGVTPTTDRVQVLRYGPESTQAMRDEDTAVLTLPIEWLRDINIVDTPGTNAVIQRHQRITEDFVPRSDLVLFVTSADRPFAESERIFLERVREWGKKVVVVINKIDIFEDESHIQQVIEFVGHNAQQLLGMRPSDFCGLGAAGPESEDCHGRGAIGVVAGQLFWSARRIHSDHARRTTAAPPQIRKPARHRCPSGG